MKTKTRKLIAFVLCFFMCVSLMPEVPALAIVKNEEQTNVYEYGSITDAQTANFNGEIIEYHDIGKEESGTAGKKVRLDFYANIAEEFKSIETLLSFDPDVTYLCSSDWATDDYSDPTNAEYIKSVFYPAKIGTTALLTAKGQATSGMGPGKLTADSWMMTGGAETEANALWNLLMANSEDDHYDSSRQILDMSVVTNEDTAGIKNWYDAMDSNFNIKVSDAYKAEKGSALMHIYSLYFQAKDGQTITHDTFGIARYKLGSTDTYYLGCRVSRTLENIEVVTNNIAMVGFPEAPEATYDFVITATNASGQAVKNAIIELYGTSTKGTSIAGNYIPEAQRTTDENGRINIKLPAGTGYSFRVGNGVGATDGKTYKYSDTNATTFEVSSTLSSKTYSGMTELTNQFPVTIKAVNAAGGPLSLDGTAITIGTKTVSASEISEGVASFDIAQTDTINLTISGVDGYQNITDNAVQVTVTPDKEDNGDDSTTSATLSTTSKNVKIVDGKTVVVTLNMTTTRVDIPVGVPEGITGDQADTIKCTATPVAGSSEELKKEVGVEGITVDAVVEKDSEGNVTSITVSPDLPDGSYDVVISGSGLEPIKKTVTVITGIDEDGNITRVANIGGTADHDANGEVSGITGGTTGTKTESGKTLSDNGSVSFKPDTDAEVTTGGSTTADPSTGDVTPPKKGDSGVTEVIGGLPGSDDNITTTVITDPLYLVKVTENYNATKDKVESVTLDVYLKNANATAGTIGLALDSDIFAKPSDTSTTLVGDIEFRDMFNPSSPAATKPNIDTVGNNHYVSFYWNVNNTATSVDARGGEVKIATIEVDVNTAYQDLEVLKKAINTTSITVMNFNDTTEGQAIISKYTSATAKGALNSIGPIWRETSAFVNEQVTKEKFRITDLTKAISGGFYQYYAPETETANSSDAVSEPHDIFVQFELPKIIELKGADFHVTENDTSIDIDNARILVYNVDPIADTSAAPIADTLTKNGGYAHVSLEPGKYYYIVTEAGHWDYPDGTVTNGGKYVYDNFEITAEGVIKMGMVLEDGTKGTPVVDGYINPRMAPKSFHEVSLDSTVTDASITSSNIAYNNIKYTVNIQPTAGHAWNVGSGATYADMDALAAAMKATRYEVDASAASVTDAFRNNVGKVENIVIKWDAVTEQFYIEDTDIKGDMINISNLTDGTAVNSLRAGDIVIYVPTDAVTFGSYTITAVAGNGGTLAVNTPGDANTITPDGDNTASNYKEVLSDGQTTSSTFTFTADGTNLISHVYINGVEVTLPTTEETTYTYTFKNVSSDQDIHVSFKDEDGKELSDPYVTVEVGSHGEADVTLPSTTPETLDGPASKAYEVAAGSGPVTVTITPKPDVDFEVDTILVNGTPITVTPKTGTDGNPIKDGEGRLTYDDVTVSLDKGDNESVVITFKPIDGDSVQAVVIATIVGGSGNSNPVGISIYAVGDTPTYVMTPDNTWTLDNTKDSEAVKVDGTDVSDKVGTTDGTTFNYQMDPVSGTVKLDILFTEETFTINGMILISADAQSTVDYAYLTYTRASDGKVVTDKSGNNAVSAIMNGTTSFKAINFATKLPAGKWTLEVKKQGYLTYTITDFEVKKDEIGTDMSLWFGGETDTQHQAIPLTGGDAYGEGITVEMRDVSVVVSGWLSGASSANKLKGDVNESNFTTGGISNTDDMAAVQNSMYKEATEMTYADFCAQTYKVNK